MVQNKQRVKYQNSSPDSKQIQNRIQETRSETDRETLTCKQYWDNKRLVETGELAILRNMIYKQHGL